MAEAEERAGGILQDLPLFGIPVGVKDIIATRGIPTRYGSRIYATNVPVTSAWVVRRLEALGGLVMGKTVTTEFAYRQPGKTRNPWNAAFSPGGSSSGSAAAVATAPRLAVVRTPKWPLASEAQKANFEAAVAQLREAGAQVREVNLPKLFDDAWDNVMVILARDAVRSFLSIESRHRIRLSPHL